MTMVKKTLGYVELEWECPKCGATMKIGWYATAEVRGDVQDA